MHCDAVTVDLHGISLFVAVKQELEGVCGCDYLTRLFELEYCWLGH